MIFSKCLFAAIYVHIKITKSIVILSSFINFITGWWLLFGLGCVVFFFSGKVKFCSYIHAVQSGEARMFSQLV